MRFADGASLTRPATSQPYSRPLTSPRRPMSARGPIILETHRVITTAGAGPPKLLSRDVRYAAGSLRLASPTNRLRRPSFQLPSRCNPSIAGWRHQPTLAQETHPRRIVARVRANICRNRVFEILPVPRPGERPFQSSGPLCRRLFAGPCSSPVTFITPCSQAHCKMASMDVVGLKTETWSGTDAAAVTSAQLARAY